MPRAYCHLIVILAVATVVGATTSIAAVADHRTVEPAPSLAIAQIGELTQFQIYHNIWGNVGNFGEPGALDWVKEQVDLMQDPGPSTDPPLSVALVEACSKQARAYQEELESRFGVTYLLGFHDQFPEENIDPVDRPATTCWEEDDPDPDTPVEEFGVAVIQLATEGSVLFAGPFPDTVVDDHGMSQISQAPGDEDRGYVCVSGGPGLLVTCTAHMHNRDHANDTEYARWQLHAYKQAVESFVGSSGLPVVWSGDLYRNTGEIAGYYPDFYSEHVEADSSVCPGANDPDRPTQHGAADRKVDHVFLALDSVDDFSCEQAYVTPLSEVCTLNQANLASETISTTSTSLPPDVPCDGDGTEGNGRFDHSLIRANFDIGIVDSSAPVTSVSVSPVANAAGWHDGPVTVSLEASDDLSGVESVSYSASGAQVIEETTVPGDTASFVVSAEGVTTVEYFATDQAGNTEASQTLVVRIDETPPVVTGTADRPPDRNDWYRAPFTVTWSGSDGLSGVESCDPPVSYAGPDTSAGVLGGFCTDVAGNTGSGEFSFGYDATAPTVTAMADREPDFNDWYNEPVTVTFAGSDEMSGIDACDSPVAYSGPDGEDLFVSGSCVDVAGNSASDSFGPFRYDDTPPVATIDGGSTQLILNALNPSMSGVASDNLAGIWLIAVEFENAADPTDTALRVAECPTDCLSASSTPWTVDTAGLAGVYTVRVIAADLAGNAGEWSSPVTAIIL